MARPYQVRGSLEALVEGWHGVLDSGNVAAVFNTTTMGRGE